MVTVALVTLLAVGNVTAAFAAAPGGAVNDEVADESGDESGEESGDESGENERRNGFDDPFVRATDGLPACPRQEAPRITLAEMRAQAHSRVERGADCYRSGRCRLPNSYLYDREIVPRVVLALRRDARFDDSSIWVEGRRRWVWLKGCVRDREQAVAAERVARSIEDVEQVIDELEVLSCTSGKNCLPTATRSTR